jgi:predicted aldo/keto reductase-like oxidoreductase
MCEQKEARDALELAFANGINHIDIAPVYGNAQRVAGPWIGEHRAHIFLGCKTMERDYAEAWRDLENSLELLRTDTIDLYQFHAVTTMDEVDQIFAPDGAAKMVLEAQEQGLVKWLGITGHGMFAPAVQSAVLERMDLDTIMFPLNPRLFGDVNYRTETGKLLQTAAERDLGVMTIKAGSKAPWRGREKTYTPWYEPYDVQEEITADVHFALSQPSVVAVTGAGDVRLLPLFIQAMESYEPMNADEQEKLIDKRADNQMIFDGAKQIF